ncbi:hypothetical protein BGW80DRAFT_261568 [Lactifluus volemus]|nr:hypothetical protein BGW80DRAFT_261568 [Lactifluus volemus]
MPHDLWIAIDLDLDGEEWMRYDKFTLRVSWPASHPVQVALTLYPVLTVTGRTSERASASSSARMARLYIAQIHLTLRESAYLILLWQSKKKWDGVAHRIGRTARTRRATDVRDTRNMDVARSVGRWNVWSVAVGVEDG